MKKQTTLIRLQTGILFLLAMFLTNLSIAQRTVVVDSTEYGGLNHAIVSDTTNEGARVDPSTIYVLKRGETYILNGAINPKGYTLTIIAEDGTGAKPKLVPGVSDGGESDVPFVAEGNLVLRNLEITARTELGGLEDRLIRVRDDNVRVIVDNCRLDESGQAFIRLDNPGAKVYVTNSVISRIGVPDDIDNGRGIDDRGNDVDTIFVQNNTFYNVSQRLYRDGGGVIKYVFWDHNTCVNMGVYVAVFGEVVDFTFTNNIVINANFVGNAQELLLDGTLDPDDGPSAKLVIDTVSADYLANIGATQKAVISHNNMYVRQSVIDARPDRDPESPEDSIVSRVDWSPTAIAYMENAGTLETNISEDLVFKKGPVDPIVFIQQWWADPLREDVDPWVATGAPYEFNYLDNTLSASASSTGEQLGDTNWPLTATGITGLRNLITESKAMATSASVGNNIGQYPQSAIDALNSAIASAELVSENPAATPEQIEASTDDLNDAKSAFEGMLVTGLSDELGNSIASIYPNPTFDFVKIKLDASVHSISVYNTSGKMLQRYSGLKHKELSINMNGYQNGVYILQFELSTGKTLNNKIVKF
ncbi:MAG: T9SS type A sorting domain-containing protein [Cyclobacteriaceae bacterium]|nr:T9SS type A sorting domain-containing protein [Cyclobacteriaceae bacterium]